MTAATPARSTIRSAVLAVAVTAVAASIANLAISLVAQAVGADSTVFGGLSPAEFVPFTVIGTIAGVIGWIIVRRRASRPSAVLRRLVPTVVAISWLPDFGVGVTMGWDGGVTFALMHVAVAAIAVSAFRYFLPLPR
jgi:Ca2+/Na+ antiporter